MLQRFVGEIVAAEVRRRSSCIEKVAAKRVVGKVVAAKRFVGEIVAVEVRRQSSCIGKVAAKRFVGKVVAAEVRRRSSRCRVS